MAAAFVQMSLLDLLQVETPTADNQSGCYPGKEYDTDGITSEMFESIEVRLPKAIKATVRVSLACGGSGMWYMGRSLQLNTEGSGYAAWPKFSKQYASRYLAFSAAANSALQWFRDQKMKVAALLLIRKELERIAASIDPVEFHHDSICQEWRECGYQDKCMTQNENSDVVCFKDELKKQAGQKEEQSLADLCIACKTAHLGCDSCCAHCKNECNAGQRCTWPSADVSTQPEKAETGWRNIMTFGFSRDQAKVLAAGFMLVRYTREEKLVEVSAPLMEEGWKQFEPFPTYAAAERKLKEMIESGRVNTDNTGKIIMTGWNQPGVRKEGFEFYRCYGLYEYHTSCCIKQGSTNWSNWGKYKDREELKEAWDKLMNEDPKALEG